MKSSSLFSSYDLTFINGKDLDFEKFRQLISDCSLTLSFQRSNTSPIIFSPFRVFRQSSFIYNLKQQWKLLECLNPETEYEKSKKYYRTSDWESLPERLVNTDTDYIDSYERQGEHNVTVFWQEYQSKKGRKHLSSDINFELKI